MKRKNLSRIGVMFAITSFLMLFVIPFIVAIYFPKISNNITFVCIYILSLLTFTAIGNINLEKSQSPLSLDESRDKKINQVLIEGVV